MYFSFTPRNFSDGNSTYWSFCFRSHSEKTFHLIGVETSERLFSTNKLNNFTLFFQHSTLVISLTSNRPIILLGFPQYTGTRLWPFARIFPIASLLHEEKQKHISVRSLKTGTETIYRRREERSLVYNTDD